MRGKSVTDPPYSPGRTLGTDSHAKKLWDKAKARHHVTFLSFVVDLVHESALFITTVPLLWS